MPAGASGPPLYYDVTVSYEPAVIVKYEHLQALMDLSLGRIDHVYTRIDPTAVRQELGVRFYSLARPPPQPFSLINFTSVRRRYDAAAQAPFLADAVAASHQQYHRPSQRAQPGLVRRAARSLMSMVFQRDE